MKNRIKTLLSNNKKGILSMYFTAGFPALKDTVTIAESLASAGADIIEIGIPYSDPVADGPTIQASNTVALKNGMRLSMLIEQVKQIRKTVDIPIILMGYINPVLQYGIEKFAKDAAEAGVDGVILPDMPMDEYLEHYKKLFDSLNLSNTFLISPTTSEERIRKIDQVTDGFIYAVSASSITGAKGKFEKQQLDYFDRIKNMKLRNPYLIGFGISNHDTFSMATKYGAGAIVGSAFVDLLKNSKDLKRDISAFVKSLKNGQSH
ncbi:tryptophan synthase subunit alpha [Chryseolinea sp. H1M3-3]|uniref:tryptophan synthase subunit alpha n=1 Tax=Chryseolinea sp. H1M3-3 TaxID=3034144 RepID=UPI0023ED53DB|nr:tryptophan synthase subunit alpha [Chryseolinea sp. H1M3-3]